MLRHLSVFRSRFTLESALAVCSAQQARGAGASADDLFDLMAKSLLSSDIGGEAVQYWLLETTRQYASELLAASGEEAELAPRHAQHMLELSIQTEVEREQVPTDVWRARHAYRIDDVRASLAWAFGPAGDTATGISLAATSAPLWFALSRMAEFLHIAEQALAAMRRDGISDPLREMALCDAYGHALWHIRGAGEGAWATFQRALEIAAEAGSDADRLRALFGLWLIANSAGGYRQATVLAERSGEIAARGPDAARLLHHRMMALSMHYSGQHERARSHAQRVLDAPITVNPGARNSGFHFDHRVAAHTALARIYWVLGFPDQAVGHAHEAVERALAIGHLLSLVYALATGCAPVAFWVGDWAEANRYTQMLERRAEEYSLLFWQALRRRVSPPARAARGLGDPRCTREPLYPHALARQPLHHRRRPGQRLDAGAGRERRGSLVRAGTRYWRLGSIFGVGNAKPGYR